MRRRLLAASAAWLVLAAPAGAEPIGLRPLGGEWETARTVGPGHWVVEVGGWAGQFQPMEPFDEKDAEVLAGWQRLPAWPDLRGLYGLGDGNEVVVQLGQVVGGGYRRHFLRAEAPWGGEYLQGLIQLGGGFHLASFLPVGYVRFPALYERGAWTFHVAPGGYYMFNQQPIVDVNLGAEFRPIEQLHLGAQALLRMDAKQVTPMEGSWAFGGGVRYQVTEQWALQVEGRQDGGPPLPAGTVVQPTIEFPLQAVKASVTYYY